MLRANAAFAIYWLTPRLRRFQDAHPSINLRINISAWLTETEWEAVSLEVSYGRSAWSGLRCQQMTHETLFPVCAPTLLSKQPGLNQIAELGQQNLLHVIGNNEGWAHWLEAPENTVAAREADIDVSAGVQFDTSALALEYAAAGGGIAIGASSLTRAMLNSGQLVAPFQVHVPSNEAFYLASPEARTDSPSSAALRAWLLTEAAADRIHESPDHE